MRTIARAVRHVQSASLLRQGSFMNGLVRKQRPLVNPVTGSAYTPSYSEETDRSLHLSMVSRTLFTSAAKDTSGGFFF